VNPDSGFHTLLLPPNGESLQKTYNRKKLLIHPNGHAIMTDIRIKRVFLSAFHFPTID
jgi:hypothetical protein